MMKSFLSVVSIISFWIIAHQAISADITVNYSGEVTQATCKIQGGTSINVPLGLINTTDLKKDNRWYTAATSAPLILVGCPGWVSITFTGNEATDSPKDLKLSNLGQLDAAAGVAIRPFIEILGAYTGQGSGNMRIEMPRTETKAITGSSIHLTIGGAMVRTNAEKTIAGKVEGNMNLTFTYR